MVYNLSELYNVSGNYDVSRADTTLWVAIIGSRGASREELKAAYWLGYKCAKNNKVIVSGLARGIDTAAMRGSTDAGGVTIGIVSTPPTQQIYPKENTWLAERIKRNGCIIHAFSTPAEYTSTSGLNQFQRRLIERDLLVAMLCPILVAVKAEDEVITGGTKWAMHYGAEYGHRTFRFDSKGRFYESPPVEDCNIWKNTEIIFPKCTGKPE
jgi:predicted Rossmann fold nucleotide-binding protein DprA/Smf involved in DNA uptake